jgi:hypothetical protein
MADGATAIVLNTASGGANLGVDQVTVALVATDYQIVKIGYSDSGAQPVQIGPSNPLPVSVTGTAAVSNFPAKQAVSVAGADGTVNIAGTPAVSLSGANGTVNIVGTVPVIISGTLGTVNINNKPAVSVAGADGTVNVVGTVPILVAASSTFTLGTVAFAGTPGVALTGANGTVNVVGTIPVVNVTSTFTLGTVALAGTPAVSLSGANGTVNLVGTPGVALTGANGTVNVVGTVPILVAASSTFTLGTVAFAGTPGVAVTGANGTVNIVTLAAGTATVVLIGANGTVNIVGSATIAAGAAPASGLVVLSVYNTAAPAPTSGQSMAQQCDYAGNLFTIKRRSQSLGTGLLLAGGGTATLCAAQAAGIFSDLSNLVVSLSSAVAAGGTGAYNLAFTDGTTTYTYNLNITAGPIATPLTLFFDPPLKAGGAAAPWTIRALSTIGTANVIANFVLQKQA